MKRTVFALLLVACFVSAAVADDSAKTTSVVSAATSTKIFVSDYINNVVNIYNTSGKQVAQFTGFNGPEGLATDVKGNLYVVDTENHQILVYAPPYTKKPKKFSVPGFCPTDVAVITIGGTTYVGVANYCCGAGSLIVYKNGKAQKPILNPGVYYLGFDPKGNIFAEGRDVNNNVVVGEVAKAVHNGLRRRVEIETRVGREKAGKERAAGNSVHRNCVDLPGNSCHPWSNSACSPVM